MKKIINVVLIMSYIVLCHQVFIAIPEANDRRGEQNVLREMPKAKREFGKRDSNAFAKFRYKVTQFETAEGFEGEAEMEAARRVLDIHPAEVYCLMENNCDN